MQYEPKSKSVHAHPVYIEYRHDGGGVHVTFEQMLNDLYAEYQEAILYLPSELEDWYSNHDSHGESQYEWRIRYNGDKQVAILKYRWHDPDCLGYTPMDVICKVRPLLTIHEIKDASGLTYQELAQRFCIPPSTMDDWETGERKPAMYTRIMMQEILGI